MHSHSRTSIAVVFAVLIAVSASAAPEGRSESRDWLTRRITRIVEQLKSIFAPSPLTDPDPIPPKP